MDYDPVSEVEDEILTIDKKIIEELLEFRRSEPKLPMLPGVDVSDDCARLSVILNDLVDRIIEGIEHHPTKLWVLKEFQCSLELVSGEDTEAREHFGVEVEKVMDILGIESSDGILAYYLGGI